MESSVSRAGVSHRLSGAKLHSEEQHEKGRLILSWVGAEQPSSTRSLTSSQDGQRRRTREKPGRKTTSFQHERPPEGPLITHAPVGGFGFRDLILIILPFIEVVMNMY